jgi:hypothetical protein
MENKDSLILESQKIIDFLALQQKDQANQKLLEVSNLLDDILDATQNDDDLVELHKYQILLNHLNIKING